MVKCKFGALDPTHKQEYEVVFFLWEFFHEGIHAAQEVAVLQFRQTVLQNDVSYCISFSEIKKILAILILSKVRRSNFLYLNQI